MKPQTKRVISSILIFAIGIALIASAMGYSLVILNKQTAGEYKVTLVGNAIDDYPENETLNQTEYSAETYSRLASNGGTAGVYFYDSNLQDTKQPDFIDKLQGNQYIGIDGYAYEYTIETKKTVNTVGLIRRFLSGVALLSGATLIFSGAIRLTERFS